MHESIKYSEVMLNESTVSAGLNGSQQMDFQFGVRTTSAFQASAPDNESKYMRAIVHVTIDADFKAVKFDVDLGGLPSPLVSDGNEVVVNFHVSDFKNNGTFWTDSNGLEMQKRILNYRPSFTMDSWYYEHNITANYYPINSAISMDDVSTGRHFTVMNDKPQGGSALSDGNIEFMQNRILTNDDGLGQDDHLEEMDQTGHHIRVRATYYVQISGKAQKSVQRLVQHKVADPAQYFFAFDLERINIQKNMKRSASMFGAWLKKAGVNETVRMVTIPRGKNSFDIRLENLADNYDSQEKNAMRSVSLPDIVNAMWMEANGWTKYGSYTATELSLTGNMKYAEMSKRKIFWKTRDDEKLGRVQQDGVIEGMGASGEVLLGPQAIRVFNIMYTAAEEKATFLQ